MQVLITDKYFNKMGKVVSTLIRPIRNFNVEERARSVISKEKPTQAPQFESTKKLLEAAQKSMYSTSKRQIF